jgi:hypothetical protein
MADERSLICIAPSRVPDVRSEGSSEATVSTARLLTSGHIFRPCLNVMPFVYLFTLVRAGDVAEHTVDGRYTSRANHEDLPVFFPARVRRRCALRPVPRQEPRAAHCRSAWAPRHGPGRERLRMDQDVRSLSSNKKELCKWGSFPHGM